MSSAGLYDIGYGVDLAIYDENGTLIFGSQGIVEDHPIPHAIAVQNDFWKILSVPEGGWQAFIAETLMTYRIIGIFIILLVFTLIQLFVFRQKNLENVVLQRSQELEAEILERLQIQEDLRKSRDQLQTAEQMGSLGTWEWDEAEEEFTLSQEIHRIFGLPGGNYKPTCKKL